MYLEGTSWTQKNLAFLDAAVQLLPMRGVPSFYMDETNKHCKQVTTEWRQYDVIMTL